MANVATRYLARLVRNCPLAARPPSGGKASSTCHHDAAEAIARGDGGEAAAGPQGGSSEGMSCGPGRKESPVMRLVVKEQALGIEWLQL